MVDFVFFFITFKYNTIINMITVGHVCPPVVDFVFFFIVFNVHPQNHARLEASRNEGVWVVIKTITSKY